MRHFLLHVLGIDPTVFVPAHTDGDEDDDDEGDGRHPRDDGEHKMPVRPLVTAHHQPRLVASHILHLKLHQLSAAAGPDSAPHLRPWARDCIRMSELPLMQLILFKVKSAALG